MIISKKIQAKDNHINFLVQEVRSKRIEEQLEVKKTQDAIQKFKEKLVREAHPKFPNVFWHRDEHVIELPYNLEFRENNIPTKARPIQIIQKPLRYYEKEI